MTRIYKYILLMRKAKKKKEKIGELKEVLTLQDLEKIRSKFGLTDKEMIKVFLD